MAIADLDFRVNVRDTASRALYRVGDSFRDAGGRVNDFSRRLENAAGRSTVASRALSRVGDGLTRLGVRAVDANIRLRNTSRNADDSSNAFTRMGAAAARAGSKITGGLSALGGKVGMSNPYVGGALAIAAAILSIYAIAVATGAVLAGLGGGFLALGFKGQKGSVAVQKAMTALGDTTKTVLKNASGALAGDFVDAFYALRKTVLGTEAGLKRMFDVLSNSGALASLTKGIDGFAKNIMPGLSKAMDAAAPLLVELGKALPELGASFAQFFADLGKAGPGATKALVSFLAIVGNQIEMLGEIMYRASDAWDRFTNALSAIADKLSPVTDRLSTVMSMLTGVTPLNESFGRSLAASAASAEKKATALKKITAELVKQGAIVIDGREAERGFQAAIDDATGSIKENGRTLDENTAKGRANATALDAIATATHAKHEAATKASWSEKALTATLQTGADATFKQALAFGMGRKAAFDYAASVIGIPPSKKTIIDLAGIAKARGDVQGYRNMLALIPREVWTTLKVDQSRGSANSAERRLQARAAGGPVTKGTPYIVGEKRPEVFVPDVNGMILPRVPAGVGTFNAVTHPGRTAAAAASGGGGSRVQVEVSLAPTGDRLLDEILKGLRFRVASKHGGSVQRAFGT